jgi:hypothetical protein
VCIAYAAGVPPAAKVIEIPRVPMHAPLCARRKLPRKKRVARLEYRWDESKHRGDGYLQLE